MADVTHATQTAILDAARDAIIEHGIRRTTAADIAKRSGLARQTLYRYWPDTQSLFAALITRELLAQVPPEVEAADLGDLVAVLVDTAAAIKALPIVERLRTTDPELFATYILERLGASQHAMLAALVQRLEHGQSRGFVRVGDSGSLAAMVLLIAQSAVQSAPLVEPWLAGRRWSIELGYALRGYLAPQHE
ncbi:TetR/AcrR family transcriptional regulator (plasmid) [Coraliomargarita sp. W4R53]